MVVACSGQPAPPPDMAAPPDVAASPAIQGETTGGDGSQVTLLALTAEQLQDVEVPGELACGFDDANLDTLLVARADVLPDAPVRGVVNHNGYVEMLGNGRAGGFNDLLDGITLSGKGLTVHLDRQDPQPTGDESTRHAATLTVQRADGAERIYRGTLSCGP